MKKIFKEYRLEIIVIAIVLLVELSMIKGLGVRWRVIRAAYVTGEYIKNLLTSGASAIGTKASHFDIYFFLNLLFLLAVFGFIGYRVRNNILQSDAWRSTVCPRCGGDLHRTHRSTLDRLMMNVLILSGRRYTCSNCKWTGLMRA